MTPDSDAFALYERMRLKLARAFYRRAFAFPLNAGNLFEFVLKTTKKTLFLDDTDIRYIQAIASRFYKSRSRHLQSITFNFMKKLINIFAGSTMKHRRGHIVSKLLMFYPDIALRYSLQSEIFSKASRHAVELCSIRCAYRVYALRAFDPAQFDAFPLDRFKSDAIENLLILATAKIDSFTDLEHWVHASVEFLSVVTEKHDHCKLVIKICAFLSQLFEVIANNNIAECCAVIRSSNLLPWALAHVRSPTEGRTCCEAVAHLLRNAFRFGDGSIKMFLVDLGVFEIVFEMFLDNRPEVVAQLLDFLTAVCTGPDLLYINHALNNNVIALVVPLVKYPLHAEGIQQKASRALDTFFANANVEQMFRGLDQGMLSAMIMLLKSKKERALTNVLRWLFIVIERLEKEATDLELLMRFKYLVRQARGYEALLKLFAHENDNISRSAFIVHELLEGSGERLTKLDETRRKANKRFMLETISL